MPRLSLWPNKCRACKGQPTPPPCYQCTFNLQKPPPKYKSLPSHIQQSGLRSRSPSVEENPPAYYLEDPATMDEDQEREFGSRNSFYDNVGSNALDPFNTLQDDEMSVLSLTQSLGRLALVMVPTESPWQQGIATGSLQRSRHRSSPSGFLTTTNHDRLSRHNSGPLISSHMNGADGSTPDTSFPSTSHSSRSSSPGPQHLLLSALTNRLSDGDLQALQEPLSPRACSPLPCQLLIPE